MVVGLSVWLRVFLLDGCSQPSPKKCIPDLRHPPPRCLEPGSGLGGRCSVSGGLDGLGVWGLRAKGLGPQGLALTWTGRPERGLLDSASSSWSSDGAVVSGGAGEAAEGDAGGDAADAADSSIAAAASVRTSWTLFASRRSPFLSGPGEIRTDSEPL